MEENRLKRHLLDVTFEQGFLGNTYPKTVTPIVIQGWDTRRGSSMPFWRSRIRKGWDATTAFNGSKWELLATRQSANVDFAWYSSQVIDSFFHLSGYPAAQGLPASPEYPSDIGIQTSARNQAITKFIAKAKSHQHELNGVAFLGQLGENARLIMDLVRGLRQLVHGHLDGLGKIAKSLKKGSGRLDAAADLWLQFAFGWKPLAMDLEDALRAYKSKLEGRKSSYIYAAGRDRTSGVPFDNRTSFGCIILDKTYHTEEHALVMLRGVVRHELYAPTGVFGELPSFLQHYGLDMDSWVPGAYELLPWSFLVDYFVNIGDILEAVYFRRSSLMWACQTEVLTKDCIVIAKFNKAETEKYLTTYYSRGPYKISGDGSGYARMRGKYVRRGPAVSLIPTLEFRIPKIGSSRWINIAALLQTHGKLLPHFQ